MRRIFILIVLGTALLVAIPARSQLRILGQDNVVPYVCRSYTSSGGELPTVLLGAANGISILAPAAGAGGLAVGSISAVIIEE